MGRKPKPKLSFTDKYLRRVHKEYRLHYLYWWLYVGIAELVFTIFNYPGTGIPWYVIWWGNWVVVILIFTGYYKIPRKIKNGFYKFKK